jgi:hypothetical protein
MPTSTLPSTIGLFCQIMAPSVKSIAGTFWDFVVALWPWGWILIVPSFAIWIAFEIATRNGNWHYNSKNGFSPTFNIFVGSGTNLLIQSLTHGFLSGIFGDLAYCNPWASVLHIFIFIATGVLLNVTGFWVYLKLPNLPRAPRGKKKSHKRRW